MYKEPIQLTALASVTKQNTYTLTMAMISCNDVKQSPTRCVITTILIDQWNNLCLTDAYMYEHIPYDWTTTIYQCVTVITERCEVVFRVVS